MWQTLYFYPGYWLLGKCKEALLNELFLVMWQTLYFYPGYNILSYVIYMTDATSGTGTAYPSGAPEFTPVFSGVLEYGASISCGNILPFLHLHKTLTNIHHSRIYKYIIIVVHVPVIYSIAMTMLISVDNT
jgi:hypothetical protein